MWGIQLQYFPFFLWLQGISVELLDGLMMSVDMWTYGLKNVPKLSL